MDKYVVVLKGSDKVVIIEEGFYYGQPTEDKYNVRYYTKEELNKMMENPYFIKNIFDGKVEIKRVVFSFSKPIPIKEVSVPIEKKWAIK